MVEPWLSGSLTGVHPVLRAVLHALAQSRQDLASWTAPLSTEQLWARPKDAAPVGFHIRHIAGSVDRLFTYAMENGLSDAQMEALRSELVPGAGRAELLAELDAVLDRVDVEIRTIDPARLGEPRTVGRKQLPSTLAGLLIHIAEHTQRHTGQAIVMARMVRD